MPHKPLRRVGCASASPLVTRRAFGGSRPFRFWSVAFWFVSCFAGTLGLLKVARGQNKCRTSMDLMSLNPLE